MVRATPFQPVPLLLPLRPAGLGKRGDKLLTMPKLSSSRSVQATTTKVYRPRKLGKDAPMPVFVLLEKLGPGLPNDVEMQQEQYQ